MTRDPAAYRPQPKRTGTDRWLTELDLIAAFVDVILPFLPAGVVWEPAAGDGRLAMAIRAAGRSVIASDVDPQASDIARHDFLLTAPPVSGCLVATNPPFRDPLLDAFIARGRALIDSGEARAVIFLLRSDHLFTDGRAELLDQADGLFACNWRPRWIEGTTGNPRWSFAWVVWCPGLPKTFRFLRRPGRRQRDHRQLRFDLLSAAADD